MDLKLEILNPNPSILCQVRITKFDNDYSGLFVQVVWNYSTRESRKLSENQ